jgi:hypothetical protein
MNPIKLPALATLTVALIASPATAYADCGDPGQPPWVAQVERDQAHSAGL